MTAANNRPNVGSEYFIDPDTGIRYVRVLPQSVDTNDNPVITEDSPEQ